jgi:NAD+ synthase (glutamine-hydrolysing)
MCASPALKVADIDFNKRSILEVIEKSVEQKVHILVFPELSITGYSCADLFYQSIFCKKAMEALLDIASYCQNHSIIVILGLPVLNNSKLYNCAGLIHGGKILGFVPKTYIPNTKEYYEARWFSSSTSNTDKFLVVEGLNIPFGSDIIFQVQNLPFCKIGIEICEDLWALSPPSTDMALSGATVIANPSASNELIGKSKYRSELVRSQSARCNFAYLYASAGPGESSTDTVFSGHSIISENGKVLSETERFKFISQTCCADIDLEKLSFERTMNSSYKTSIKNVEFRTVGFLFEGVEALSLTDASQLFTTISRTPFVPQSEEEKKSSFR